MRNISLLSRTALIVKRPAAAQSSSVITLNCVMAIVLQSSQDPHSESTHYRLRGLSVAASWSRAMKGRPPIVAARQLGQQTGGVSDDRYSSSINGSIACFTSSNAIRSVTRWHRMNYCVTRVPRKCVTGGPATKKGLTANGRKSLGTSRYV